MTNFERPDVSQLMNIAAVERDSGLPKDTLRVWERRYGFPAPLRDQHDERLYPPEQVATLRLLRRLVDVGYRPGKVVGLPDADLTRLLEGVSGSAQQPLGAEAREVLALLGASDAIGLREALGAMVLRVGLGDFAATVGPGLAQAVGAAWSRGELEIHQEHLFTEQFTNVLRGSIHMAQWAGAPRSRPRVLFGTFPQEPHALGLLMAEAMFTLEGCLGISLGVQTPITEIAAAARAHQADILALSFSAMIPPSQATAGLDELRALAPATAEIWAGGACPGLRDKPGLKIVRGLSEIAPAVRAWRARAAEPD